MTTRPPFAAAVEAAIAEVEAVARAATSPWGADEDEWRLGTHLETVVHIAMNDPQTVLRRCERDREILARCAAVPVGMPSYHLAQGVLAALASAYDVEPGRQEVGG